MRTLRSEVLEKVRYGPRLIDARNATWNVVVSTFLVAMIVVPDTSASGPAAAKRMEVLQPQQSEVRTKSPQEIADTGISSELAAQTIRQQVVEFASTQFGPSLLNDWNHPSTTWPTQTDTYVMAYIKLMQMELSAQRPDDVAPDTKVATTIPSGAFRFLVKVLGGQLGPAGDVIENAASTANRANRTPSPPSSFYEAHLREVLAVAEAVLSPEDYQAYAHAAEIGDYATQTGLLFKVNNAVLSGQPVVNPYVLWWCDMRGSDGRIGSRPVYDFPEIAPEDDRFKRAKWDDTTQVQRWNAVYDALRKWFQRTSSAMNDPSQRAALLSSVKIQSEEHSRRPALGPDAAQVNRDLVAALGSKALEQYEHASAEKRATVLRTAALFNEGLNSFLPMLIGAPSLSVDGTVIPLARHP